MFLKITTGKGRGGVLFNFLALFVAVIAFLLTRTVCIQQTLNSARSHKKSLFFRQCCDAAAAAVVIFLNCFCRGKTKPCFSDIIDLHLGDALYGAPLSRHTRAVGG